MNETELLPFPAPGEKGPQVCEAVRVYLAIVDDLSFEQLRVLSEHVQDCPACAAEFRQMQNVTRLVRTLPERTPSARVDEAVLAAIRARTRTPPSSVELHSMTQQTSRRRLRSRTSAFALAAVLVLLTLLGISLRGLIFSNTSNTTLQLPSTLSWNGYTLHYTQFQRDSQGHPYEIEVYQDLTTHQMHIESIMEGQFDVVVVMDEQNMMGKDMMHHVAETGHGVEPWTVDGSLFDLMHLRQELATHRMTYLGKETFRGQEVSLLQTDDGKVLLLDTNYLPVNVLRDYTGPGTGTPVYATFDLMSTSEISSSMWDMQVPSDFRVGQLPNHS